MMSSEYQDAEAIKRLKARYFRCMDTKDWAGFEAVFTTDATFESTSPVKEVTRGASAIVKWVRATLGEAVTVHHGHMPEIELTSPTTASGVWAMEDLIWWPAATPIAWPAIGPVPHLHGYGHYHETYIKDDCGTWRIATVELTRIRRERTEF